jgi:hypothetical protein
MRENTEFCMLYFLNSVPRKNLTKTASLFPAPSFSLIKINYIFRATSSNRLIHAG